MSEEDKKAKAERFAEAYNLLYGPNRKPGEFVAAAVIPTTPSPTGRIHNRERDMGELMHKGFEQLLALSPRREIEPNVQPRTWDDEHDVAIDFETQQRGAYVGMDYGTLELAVLSVVGEPDQATTLTNMLRDMGGHLTASGDHEGPQRHARLLHPSCRRQAAPRLHPA